MDESYERWFSKEKLKDLFWKKIRYRCSPGLDRVGISAFTEDLENQLSIINRKVLNGTYKFTKYNELLISKGRNKQPRCVSRPTIRDKLVLCALHGYLQEQYAETIDNRLIHTIVNDVTKNRLNYTHYIKVDIVSFYPNIDHEILLKDLSIKISDPAIDLVKKAITTPTVPKEYNSKIVKSNLATKGVPEGLSISNILANIYLNCIDTYFFDLPDVFYCRYVDDILILVNENGINKIKDNIVSKLTDLNLCVHKFGESDKSCVEECYNGFSYLGYNYSNNKVSVKKATIDKFEHSIERMFSDYKKQEKDSIQDRLHNIDMFAWRLNLKITGCIYNRRKYGWLFYYSQIDDLYLLKHFDWLVDRLFERYKIERSQIGIKSFFKTYHEIRYNLNESSYFYNVDKMNLEEIETVIRDIFHYLVPAHKDDIEELFFNVFNKNLKELERDAQFFS